MNCDYCGSKVKKSEVKMTDMGDQVCIPCLIGKPVEKQVKGIKVTLSNEAITKAFSEWSWSIEGELINDSIKGNSETIIDAVEAARSAIMSAMLNGSSAKEVK